MIYEYQVDFGNVDRIEKMMKHLIASLILAIQFLCASVTAQSWIRQSHLSSTYSLRKVAQPDSLNRWAVGFDGIILHSTNSGVDWESQNSGSQSNSWMDVSFCDSLNGWVVGDSLIAG